jgi:aminoglycoside/choline kinase family phosphotransferase
MGVIHRLALSYDGTPPAGAPTSLVVKQPSTFPANREQGVALGLYMAEVRFYRELASRTSLRVPHAYYADLGDDGDFVVVMEDLSGLRHLDQTEGMTPEQMGHAVRALAALHGPFWGEVGALDWIPSVVHARIQGFAGMFPQFWQGTRANFADRLDDGALAVGDAVAVHYWSCMQRLGERPWTLLHMDYRCDNFLYDDASPDAPLVTLDWQSLGRGPAAYDLAYLLGGSLTLEDRRTHEQDLLHEYHRVLVDHGVDDYSFDELWADYRLASLVGIGSAVLVGGGLDMGNERGVALIGSMVERHFALPVDLDALDLLP